MTERQCPWNHSSAHPHHLGAHPSTIYGTPAGKRTGLSSALVPPSMIGRILYPPANQFIYLLLVNTHVFSCIKFYRSHLTLTKVMTKCLFQDSNEMLRCVTSCKQMVACNADFKVKYIWAASWQNQQNDCAPSEDSDQPGHLPSLIRVFAVHSMGS